MSLVLEEALDDVVLGVDGGLVVVAAKQTVVVQVVPCAGDLAVVLGEI